MLSVPEVKKLLKQGLNDEQIGDILGCSKYKIHRFRKANNLPSARSLSNENKIKHVENNSYAIYNINGQDVPVIICDVKTQKSVTTFCVKSVKTGDYIKSRNIPIRFIESTAIQSGTIILKSDKYIPINKPKDNKPQPTPIIDEYRIQLNAIK